MRSVGLLLCLGALLAAAACITYPDFRNWWLTPDQQAQASFEAGDYLAAARRFEDPYRKALAYYSAEEFATAASLFATLPGADAAFYLGNAFANQDLLTDARDAYRTALDLRPEFPQAEFNLDWVEGLVTLEGAQYDDYGGTGGKLGADGVVISDRAERAQTTTTEAQLRSEGLSAEQLETLWMRRVQTTPGDFLRLKFSFQLSEAPES